MSGESAGASLEPERVVAALRPHGRALFWPSVALIVIASATGWFFGRFAQQWENLAVLGAGAVLALLFWLLPLLTWLSKRYVITTRRVVLRKGVLLRSRQELPHVETYGIVVRTNALQSLFRSGDLRIETGPGRPAVLRDVPAAALVQRTLHDLRETTVNPIAPSPQGSSRPGPQRSGPQQPGPQQPGFPQPGYPRSGDQQSGDQRSSYRQSGDHASGRPSVPFTPRSAPARGQQDETRRWGTR